MTPDMQGVIMAIGKSSSVYEKNGPEAAFFKVQPLSPFRSHSLPSPPLLLLCNIVPQTTAVFPTDLDSVCDSGIVLGAYMYTCGTQVCCLN